MFIDIYYTIFAQHIRRRIYHLLYNIYMEVINHQVSFREVFIMTQWDMLKRLTGLEGKGILLYFIQQL